MNHTSTGTTITIENRDGNRVVILDNPKAPDDMRNLEAGRIINGGYQPAFMAPWALTPETLRIIANLVDQEQS